MSATNAFARGEEKVRKGKRGKKGEEEIREGKKGGRGGNINRVEISFDLL